LKNARKAKNNPNKMPAHSESRGHFVNKNQFYGSDTARYKIRGPSSLDNNNIKVMPQT
jgi:hypothetical protein